MKQAEKGSLCLAAWTWWNRKESFILHSQGGSSCPELRNSLFFWVCQNGFSFFSKEQQFCSHTDRSFCFCNEIWNCRQSFDISMRFDRWLEKAKWLIFGCPTLCDQVSGNDDMKEFFRFRMFQLKGPLPADFPPGALSTGPTRGRRQPLGPSHTRR